MKREVNEIPYYFWYQYLPASLKSVFLSCQFYFSWVSCLTEEFHKHSGISSSEKIVSRVNSHNVVINYINKVDINGKKQKLNVSSLKN